MQHTYRTSLRLATLVSSKMFDSNQLHAFFFHGIHPPVCSSCCAMLTASVAVTAAVLPSRSLVTNAATSCTTCMPARHRQPKDPVCI
jgi:hypothetical protein